jgi:predicted RNase H-like HicB family nuclease
MVIVDAMSRLHFESYTQARAHLKELLDVAARGGAATVRRDDTRAAVVDAERLRVFLATVCPARAEVVAEAGSWWVFIPGVPVSADGATFDEAVTEMIDALREYADDWLDHLADAPDHRENWGLVQLVGLSDDEQLHSWLVGPAGERVGAS